MVRGARYAYVGFAWAFLAGLGIQVFFAGLGLFAGSENFKLHVSLGWILHLTPILIVGAAALAREERRRFLTAIALAVTVFIVPLLVLLRDSIPAIAALHPVGAVISFWLAILVARNATRLLANREPESASVAA